MRRGLILVLAAVGLLLGASSADAYIYWSSYDSGNSTVGRAGLDGKNINESLVTGIYFGAGVATDGSHIYWGESGSSPKMASVGRANPDGSDVNRTFLSGGTYGGIFGIRADANAIFWLKSGASSSISRYDTAGYGTAGGGSYVCGFDVDDTYVYWNQGHYIARALRSGAAADPTWLDLGVGNEACSVAVNSSHIYWTLVQPQTDFRGRSIGRANINGTGADNHFIGATVYGLSLPTGLAVEGNFVYWVNAADPADGVSAYGSIGRANLDGHGVDQTFIPNIFDPVSLDVDSAGPAAAPPAFDVPPMINFHTFAVGVGSTPSHRAVPEGATFSYDLDQAAKVTVNMKKRKAGVLVKGKCKKRHKHSGKGKPKKCDLSVAKLYRDAVAGHNELPFTGRVDGKAFKPGKYIAEFTASGDGGKSKKAKVKFTIVRAK